MAVEPAASPVAEPQILDAKPPSASSGQLASPAVESKVAFSSVNGYQARKKAGPRRQPSSKAAPAAEEGEAEAARGQVAAPEAVRADVEEPGGGGSGEFEESGRVHQRLKLNLDLNLHWARELGRVGKWAEAERGFVKVTP